MKTTETQISLANFFIYNTEFGHKEGKEAEKIFFYYPEDEIIEKQIRNVGFCAGIVRFTSTFNPSKPCESVHTEKVRMIFHQIDQNFWMVMSLNVPSYSTTLAKNDKTELKYCNDEITDTIYTAVLKQVYDLYKLFNGTLNDGLQKHGPQVLREKLKAYFVNYIEKKLNVNDCDIMNTFNGINFMPLDRSMYLKIQCLLNYLEERVPIVDKVVVMHNDQVIWSGLEQQDISLIYNYLRELVLQNTSTATSQQMSSSFIARFLINSNSISAPQASNTASTSSATSSKSQDDLLSCLNFYELDKVYLGINSDELQQYYLIPYNLSKMTFFLFIQVEDNVNKDSSSSSTSSSSSSSPSSFKLEVLKTIDDILGKHILVYVQDIADQQQKRTQINPIEKELKYFYFNRLNLAQKSTVSNIKELPKFIINLIAQLAKDMESIEPCGELFVKSGKDYWIACKKSDLREVYVIFNQKNANLISIDDEVKQLWSTDFSNIFFME